MDSWCIALTAGYPVLIAAVAKLYKDLSKSRKAHLETVEANHRTLEELKKLIEAKNL